MLAYKLHEKWNKVLRQDEILRKKGKEAALLIVAMCVAQLNLNPDERGADLGKAVQEAYKLADSLKLEKECIPKAVREAMDNMKAAKGLDTTSAASTATPHLQAPTLPSEDTVIVNSGASDADEGPEAPAASAAPAAAQGSKGKAARRRGRGGRAKADPKHPVRRRGKNAPCGDAPLHQPISMLTALNLQLTAIYGILLLY